MKNKRGFTLIEILIAIAILAILASLTSSALYHAFKTSERLKLESEKFDSLELSIVLMQRDFSQMITRAVLGSEMHVFPIFSGTELMLEFTRGGVDNPLSLEKRSKLKRVAYFCSQGKLVRRSWQALDVINRRAYEDKILLNSLSSCKFSYLSKALQTLNEWQANAVSQNQASESLPRAIQVIIGFGNTKKLSLLFPISKALYRETNDTPAKPSK